MERGDLIRSWAMDRWRQIGILLEHNKLLKTVKIYFHKDGKIATLYSRDVEIFRRSPENIRKFKQKMLEKLDKPQ